MCVLVNCSLVHAKFFCILPSSWDGHERGKNAEQCKTNSDGWTRMLRNARGTWPELLYFSIRISILSTFLTLETWHKWRPMSPYFTRQINLHEEYTCQNCHMYRFLWYPCTNVISGWTYIISFISLMDMSYVQGRILCYASFVFCCVLSVHSQKSRVAAWHAVNIMIVQPGDRCARRYALNFTGKVGTVPNDNRKALRRFYSRNFCRIKI